MLHGRLRDSLPDPDCESQTSHQLVCVFNGYPNARHLSPSSLSLPTPNSHSRFLRPISLAIMITPSFYDPTEFAHIPGWDPKPRVIALLQSMWSAPHIHSMSMH